MFLSELHQDREIHLRLMNYLKIRIRNKGLESYERKIKVNGTKTDVSNLFSLKMTNSLQSLFLASTKLISSPQTS